MTRPRNPLGRRLVSGWSWWDWLRCLLQPAAIRVRRRSKGVRVAPACSTTSIRCTPPIVRDKPGKAPDCGMDLVPVYAADEPCRGGNAWTAPFA